MNGLATVFLFYFELQITEDDVKNHLATLEVLCPDSPLLWLKDLTSYLNVKLDIAVEDLTFASKPLGKFKKNQIGIINEGK